MKMSFRYLAPLLIFLGMAIFLFRGLSIDPKKVPSPLIDKPVPEFSIRTLEDSQKLITSKDLDGQVSLVNIWATWCVSCRAEHEILNYAAKQGIKIYGINYKDELEDARRWLEARGNPYVKSAHDLDGRIGIDWGVYGVPETFVIDKKGMIRYKHTGPVYLDDLNNKLIPLIKQLEAES